MMLWLVLLLPLPQPTTIDVDLCEINHHWTYYGDEWHVSSYYVWYDWDWHHEYGYGWYVRDWRSVNDAPRPLGNVQEWDDRRLGKRLRVRHKTFSEVGTLYDKEVANQRLLPAAQRRAFH